MIVYDSLVFFEWIEIGLLERARIFIGLVFLFDYCVFEFRFLNYIIENYLSQGSQKTQKHHLRQLFSLLVILLSKWLKF